MIREWGFGDSGLFQHEKWPSLEEMQRLYTSLSTEQREELLQCLLIAAPQGPQAMMQALMPWLVSAAAQELLDPPVS